MMIVVRLGGELGIVVAREEVGSRRPVCVSIDMVNDQASDDHGKR
jgi:hypothetical protein